MTTPVARATVNAYDAAIPDDLNQLLGTHAVQEIYEGTAQQTVSGTYNGTYSVATYALATPYTPTSTTRFTIPFCSLQGLGLDVLVSAYSGTGLLAQSPIASVVIPKELISAALNSTSPSIPVMYTGATTNVAGLSVPANISNSALGAVMQSGNYVAVVGGVDSNGNLTTVTAVGLLDPSLGVSSWVTGAPYPVLIQWNSGCNVVDNTTGNNCLVSVGGITQTDIGQPTALTANVYVAQMPATRTMGGWQQQANNLPQALGLAAVASSGSYVYVIGGTTNTGGTSPTNTVYRAQLNNGALGSWTTLGTFPASLYSMSAAVINGWLVVIGGEDGSFNANSTVYAARVNANGSLGNWQSFPALPTALYNVSVGVSGNFIIAAGGTQTSTFGSHAVYTLAVTSSGAASAWVTQGATITPPGAPTFFPSQGVVIPGTSTVSSQFGLINVPPSVGAGVGQMFALSPNCANISVPIKANAAGYLVLTPITGTAGINDVSVPTVNQTGLTNWLETKTPATNFAATASQLAIPTVVYLDSSPTVGRLTHVLHTESPTAPKWDWLVWNPNGTPQMVSEITNTNINILDFATANAGTCVNASSVTLTPTNGTIATTTNTTNFASASQNPILYNANLGPISWRIMLTNSGTGSAITNKFAITAGISYTAGFYTGPLQGNETFTATLTYYNAANSAIASFVSNTITPSSTGYTPVNVSGLAPTGAVNAALTITVNGVSGPLYRFWGLQIAATNSLLYNDIVELDAPILYYRLNDATVNLLSANDASFEGGTVGNWWGAQSTLTVSASTAYVGTHSMLCTATGNNTANDAVLGTSTSMYLPVTPGNFYTALAYVKLATGTGRGTVIDIDWYKSDKTTQISNVVGASVTATSAWQQISVSGTAPANAAFARLQIYTPGTASQLGDAYYLDAVLFGLGTQTTYGAPTTTVADSSTSANTGTIVGGVSEVAPGAVTGGGAMLEDGGTGYITPNSNVTTQPGLGGNLSMEAWVNIPTTSLTNARFAVGASNNNNNHLSVTAAGIPAAAFVIGSAVGVAGTTPLSINTWHHMVATWDGTTILLYVDGVQVASATPVGSLNCPTQPWGVGVNLNSGTPNDFWLGQLAEVAVYNYALTAAQIARHYQYGSIGRQFQSWFIPGVSGLMTSIRTLTYNADGSLAQVA